MNPEDQVALGAPPVEEDLNQGSPMPGFLSQTDGYNTPDTASLIYPDNVQPSSTPLPNEMANNRAGRYSFATGDYKVANSDMFSADVALGRDNELRDRYATMDATNKDKAKVADTETLLKTKLGKEPITTEDILRVQQNAIPTKPQPHDVFERLFAENAIRTATTQPKVDSEHTLFEAKNENASVAELTTQFAQKAITRQQYAMKKLEDLEATRTIGGGLIDMAFHLFPPVDEILLHNAFKQAGGTSWLPGNNMQEMQDYYYNLPEDEYGPALDKAVSALAANNKTLASQFLRAMITHSGSDSFWENASPAIDVSTLVPIAKIPKMFNSLSRLAKVGQQTTRAVATPAVETNQVLSTLGEVVTPGMEKGREIAARTTDNAPIVSSMEAIDGEAVGALQPETALGKPSKSLSAPLARTGDELQGEAAIKMQIEQLGKPLRIDRLTGPSLEIAKDEADKLLRVQYPYANDHIIDVKLVDKENALTNNDAIEAILGDKNKVPFDNPGTAKIFATERMGLDPATDPAVIRQIGDNQYVVVITKPVNEVSPGVRYGMEIQTKNTTPNAKSSIFFGWMKGAQALTSAEATRDRVIAVHGASQLANVAKRWYKPISKLDRHEYRDMVKFLSYQRDFVDFMTKQRGIWTKERGAFDTMWKQRFSKMPSDKLYRTYITHVRLSDLDWVLRNLSVYTLKLRKGVENFHVNVGGKEDLRIEGQFVQDVDWDSPHNAMIAVLDKDTVANVGTRRMTYAKNFMGKGKYERHADSPENLSLAEFRAAVKRGVIGPSNKPGFTRIKREGLSATRDDTPLDKNGKPLAGMFGQKRVLLDVDQGLKLGYSQDDISAFVAHHYNLVNDTAYRTAATKNVGKGQHRTLSEDAVRAAYDNMQKAALDFKMPSQKQSLKDAIKSGKYKVIKPTQEGLRNFWNHEGLDLAEDQPHVDYFLVDNMKTRPLSYKQVPYKPGGHVEYTNGTHFMRQAQMEIVGGGSERTRLYKGDKTILAFENEAKGVYWTPKYEEGRRMYAEVKAGILPEATLKAYVESTLPDSFKDFKNMWAKGGGGLDINEPLVLTPKGKSVDEVQNLSLRFKDDSIPFQNTMDNPHSIFTREDIVRYTGERDGPLFTIRERGTPDQPIIDFRPASLLDPISTMDQAISGLMRGRYMEDVKLKYAEYFNAEFGDVLRSDFRENSRDPFHSLVYAEFKEDHPDRARLAAAKNFRNSMVQFLGLRNPEQQTVDWVRQQLANSIYNRAGDKALDLVAPWLLHKEKDPINFWRQYAFHENQGLFAIRQFFMQGQQVANVMAIEGLERGLKGMGAGMLQMGLQFTDNPAMMEHASKMAIGWKPEEFIEATIALNRSGFLNVGKEHQYADGYLSGRIREGKFGKFLDWGTTPFKGGDQIARTTAWNAAYLKWRAEHPGVSFRTKEAGDVLDRATILNQNMSVANAARWQKGLAAFPTQFISYRARLAEQMMGTQLTSAEKARLFGVNALMYGLPTGVGTYGFTALFPVSDWVKEAFNYYGVNVDDNAVAKFIHDGPVSMVLEAIYGQKTDFNTSYGPGPIDSPYRFLFDDDFDWWKLIGGATGSVFGEMFSNTAPFFTSIRMAVSEGEWPGYETTTQDLVDFFQSIKSVNSATKAWYIYHWGEYISKNEGTLAHVDPTAWNTIMAGVFGIGPASIPDMYTKLNNVEAREELQKKESQQVIKYFRLAWDALANKDDESAQKYFARAKIHITAGAFTWEERGKLVTQAMKQSQSRIDQVDWKWAKTRSDRYDALMRKRQGKE